MFNIMFCQHAHGSTHKGRSITAEKLIKAI